MTAGIPLRAVGEPIGQAWGSYKRVQTLLRSRAPRGELGIALGYSKLLPRRDLAGGVDADSSWNGRQWKGLTFGALKGS